MSRTQENSRAIARSQSMRAISGVPDRVTLNDRTSPMANHPLAGQHAPESALIDVPALERAYHANRPDPTVLGQRVFFGTSGPRGSSLDHTFTEAHIIAITRAICDYRQKSGIDGPLYMGKDTHALSEPAQRTALEVLCAA